MNKYKSIVSRERGTNPPSYPPPQDSASFETEVTAILDSRKRKTRVETTHCTCMKEQKSGTKRYLLLKNVKHFDVYNVTLVNTSRENRNVSKKWSAFI